MSDSLSSYRAIGLMSGSSLDGLDISYCEYVFAKDGSWSFNLLASKTAELGIWEHKLRYASSLSEKELTTWSTSFAKYLAKEVNEFIERAEIRKIDVLVSHGHTVYHHPLEGKTCQIGDGQTLADNTNLSVVNNLRQRDIELGGQGAPIVPIGDKYLFAQHRFCLNIGGIANISFKLGDIMLAYDICPANQVLNHFAVKLGNPYDDGGRWAREGKLNSILLKELNKLSYYQQEYPKSLDNSFSKELIGVINNFEHNEKNALCTFIEHVALQLAINVRRIAKEHAIPLDLSNSILITGGGAFNEFLIERIKCLVELNVVLPDKDIINYKEAIVMGLIGVLRLSKEINVMRSVTGAKRDSSCGDIYFPESQKLL